MATLGKKAPKTKGIKSKPKSKGISEKQEKAQERIKKISRKADEIQKAGGMRTEVKKVYRINRKDAIKDANEELYGKKKRNTIGKKKSDSKKKTASKAKPKKKGFSLF